MQIRGYFGLILSSSCTLVYIPIFILWKSVNTILKENMWTNSRTDRHVFSTVCSYRAFVAKNVCSPEIRSDTLPNCYPLHRGVRSVGEHRHVAGSPYSSVLCRLYNPIFFCWAGNMRPLTLIEQAWFKCVGMNIKANCPPDSFLFFCMWFRHLFHSVCFLSRWR
jgi:hypothetical protein